MEISEEAFERFQAATKAAQQRIADLVLDLTNGRGSTKNQHRTATALPPRHPSTLGLHQVQSSSTTQYSIGVQQLRCADRLLMESDITSVRFSFAFCGVNE